MCGRWYEDSVKQYVGWLWTFFGRLLCMLEAAVVENVCLRFFVCVLYCFCVKAWWFAGEGGFAGRRPLLRMMPYD